MLVIKPKLAIATTLSFLCALVFTVSVAAQGSGGSADLKGTDSKGSFNFNKDHIRKGSSIGHGFKHRGSDGSISLFSSSDSAIDYPQHISGNSSDKAYSHKGKSSHTASKKSEGSKSKSYAHKKGHHKAEGSHGKSHGHKRLAWHGRHGHDKNIFEHALCFKKELGLTDAQIAKLKELEFEYKKKSIQFKADHQIAHMDLDWYIHSAEIDEAKIRTAGAALAAAKSQKILAMVDAKVKLLTLLTAEQRKKMNKKHTKKKK